MRFCMQLLEQTLSIILVQLWLHSNHYTTWLRVSGQAINILKKLKDSKLMLWWSTQSCSIRTLDLVMLITTLNSWRPEQKKVKIRPHWVTNTRQSSTTSLQERQGINTHTLSKGIAGTNTLGSILLSREMGLKAAWDIIEVMIWYWIS